MTSNKENSNTLAMTVLHWFIINVGVLLFFLSFFGIMLYKFWFDLEFPDSCFINLIALVVYAVVLPFAEYFISSKHKIIKMEISDEA